MAQRSIPSSFNWLDRRYPAGGARDHSFYEKGRMSIQHLMNHNPSPAPGQDFPHPRYAPLANHWFASFSEHAEQPDACLMTRQEIAVMAAVSWSYFYWRVLLIS